MMCKCGKSMMKGQSCKTCGYGKIKKSEESTSGHSEESTSSHGEQEVRMSTAQLHRICDMADMLKKVAGKEKMIPAWVQSHLAVAHENLSQVFGYMEPKHHDEAKKGFTSKAPAPGASTGGASMTPRPPKVAAPKAMKPMNPAKKSVTDVALGDEEASMKKSIVPSFPRISGGSDRILLDHLQPDQGVIKTIADRNTFAPVTVPLKPSDPTKL